jgi:hypothetical protein
MNIKGLSFQTWNDKETFDKKVFVFVQGVDILANINPVRCQQVQPDKTSPVLFAVLCLSSLSINNGGWDGKCLISSFPPHFQYAGSM